MGDYPEPDREVLAAGLEWLYRTVQPDAAIIQHHGESIGYTPNRYYGFCPAGALDLPVITVNVKGWHYGPDGSIVGALGDGEMAATAEALAGLGVRVREQWNGDGGISGSFGLTEPAHPSLTDAVDRYRAGCPVHKNPLCGWSADAGGLGCPWYRDGNRLIVGPARKMTEVARTFTESGD